MVNYLDQIQNMNHVQSQYLYETYIQIMAYSDSQNEGGNFWVRFLAQGLDS